MHSFSQFMNTARFSNRSSRVHDACSTCKRTFSAVTCVFVVTLLASTSASAQTGNSYPMLTGLHPVAVQQNARTSSTLQTIHSLYGTTVVAVHGDGITAAIEPTEWKPDANGNRPVVSNLKLNFDVSATATPGPRDFRVLTPQGASTVGQLLVTPFPVVAETPDNNTVEKSQLVTLPGTLCGLIETAEDVDVYRFHAEAGTALSIEVWGQRLENKIHDLQTHLDPIITLRNPLGSTVAAADNVSAGDPRLQYRCETAGEYSLEIRDVRYQGNPYWVYAIEVHAGPHLTQLHPFAISPAAETTVAGVGYHLPNDAAAVVRLPENCTPGIRWAATQMLGQSGTAVQCYVSPVPVVLESPNDNNTTATAQPVSIPATIAGRIDTANDVDRYSFEAKAGELFTINVIGRRAGSAIDPQLRLLNKDDGVLAEVDDFYWTRQTLSDPELRGWAAPADGNYTIEIRDLHFRGGAEFVYAIDVQRVSPAIALETDQDKSLLAAGMTTPLFVRGYRLHGFTGDIQLNVSGLPAGVTADCGRIVAGRDDGVILLTAAADLTAASLTELTVTGTAERTLADGTKQTLTATAQPMQEIYMPGGGRSHYPVAMQCVSVAEPMDVRKVTLSSNSIQLKPGESQKFEITIERSPSYNGNVTLDVIYQHLEQPYGVSLPVGVKIDGGASKTLLGAGETTGYITLTAAADAPEVRDQLVPVIAHVSINFVMKHSWAQPLRVSVVK